MKEFRATLGEPPEWNTKLPTTATDCVLWTIKLQCGFKLYFSSRLTTLYCELGLAGYLPVTRPAETDPKNEEEWDGIIDFLDKRIAQLQRTTE